MSKIIQRGQKFDDQGNEVRTDTIVECNCGKKHHIAFAGGDSACECGQLFNTFGQELRPQEQWEENYEDDY